MERRGDKNFFIGGVEGRPLRKKKDFFPTAIKLEEGGGDVKAIMAWPLRNIYFFCGESPLRIRILYMKEALYILFTALM